MATAGATSSPAPERLATLLRGVEVVAESGHPGAVEVTSVAHDSRATGPGAVFCCLAGATTDGHDHAAQAVAAGAVALVVERWVEVVVPQVKVRAARPAMATMAAALHHHPSRDLRVVGVTGTNGKTTTTYLLQAILAAHGWPTEVMGTLTGRHTTPEAPELQAGLAGLRDAGRAAVAMEVSSEAMAQHRADAVWFSAAVFTNLSPEHLNFHGDIHTYFEAKASLFAADRAAVGVVNSDDEWGRLLLAEGPIPMVPWSVADAAGLRATPSGSTFTWEGEAVHLPLP
ncbi:MAG: Mur ligase family protein, partial [Acidimicrobiales bacterium]